MSTCFTCVTVKGHAGRRAEWESLRRVEQKVARAARSLRGRRKEERVGRERLSSGKRRGGSRAHKWLKVELFDRSCLSLSLALAGDLLSVRRRHADTLVPFVVLSCSGRRLLEGIKAVWWFLPRALGCLCMERGNKGGAVLNTLPITVVNKRPGMERTTGDKATACER